MRRRTFIKSFHDAIKGIKHQLHERNFLIQTIIGVIAVLAALSLNLSESDKILVLMLAAFVLSSEAMNSACERMLDIFTEEHHPEVGKIKEILAGSVLIYSTVAFIVGLLILSHAVK